VVLFLSRRRHNHRDKPLYLEDNQGIESQLHFTLMISGSMDFTYSVPQSRATGWLYYSATYNKHYSNPHVNYRPDQN
jgi:hypothetical protein